MIGTVKLRHYIALAVIAVVGSLLALSTSASAQQADSISLNVSPTVIELDANKGEQLQGSFKIVNGSDIALDLTATPKNFTPAGEDGGVSITEDDTTYSLARWVTITPQTTNVAARGSQIFEYTINVPADAEPGGHFGSLIVATEPVQIDQTGPAVTQEVGPLVLVRIAGDTFQEASIVEFATEKNIQEKGPITFSTRVENTGNVHFKPRGTIEIKNMFGSVVTNIDLEEKNVLPGSIRKLVNDWSPTGLTAGRYTAQLTLVYGVDDTIVTASTSFIVFPYKTIIPLTILLIIILYMGIKNRDRIIKAIQVLKNG